MEENEEYIEHEDEFDIHPIEEIHKRMQHLEDEDVDVLTIDPVKRGYEQSDFTMPVLFDLGDSDSEDDIIAVGAGQFRRKSPGQGKEWMHEEDVDGGVTTSGDEQGTPRKSKSTKRRRVDSETA